MTEKLIPKLFFRNKHFNTLYRFFNNKTPVLFVRERILTNDADFIDLDISSVQSDKVILAVHGLEGSSYSSYIRSLVQKANKENLDVIAMNLRGCSGEPNRLLASYHSGKTSDLREVVEYIEQHHSYKEIHIVGYSLGGNLTIKLMGEFGEKYPKIIQSAVGVSVPCDLKGSAIVLNKGFNKLYQYGILKTLLTKANSKLKRFPNSGVDYHKVINAKNFQIYDEFYTAKINGFKSADDYYSQSSCKQYIKYIKVPCLLISALDDSFLSASCYPFDEANKNKYFTMLTPKYGGHVGFYSGFKKQNNYWLEHRILSFIQKRHPD